MRAGGLGSDGGRRRAGGVCGPSEAGCAAGPRTQGRFRDIPRGRWKPYGVADQRHPSIALPFPSSAVMV